MVLRTLSFFLFFSSLLQVAAASAQVVTSPGVGSYAPCGVSPKIKVRVSGNQNGVVTAVVEKTNDQCGASTFLASGRMEIRESSSTGRTMATAYYAAGASFVTLQFEPRVVGTTNYYAVVASDPNLYTAGPITAYGQFAVAQSAPGVSLHRYACSGCAADYVLEVDLTRARMRSLLGDASGTASAVGERSKTITERTMSDHWERAKAREANAFAVVNFAFFDAVLDRIAFPLKIGNAYGGDLLSYGYGLAVPSGGGEYPNQYRYLRYDNVADTASVVNLGYPSSMSLPQADGWLDSQSLLAGHEIVGGLAPEADKNAASWIPRMFAAVADRNGDGRPEVLFYSSELATNAYAARMLRGFGASASNVVQGDGGGSAHLLVTSSSNSTDGAQTIYSGSLLVRGASSGTARPVPHIFAIYSGY